MTRDEVMALLDEEVEGCHGESERRAVAEYVRDAMSDYPDDGRTHAEWAAAIADYLAAAATALARELRGVL